VHSCTCRCYPRTRYAHTPCALVCTSLQWAQKHWNSPPDLREGTFVPAVQVMQRLVGLKVALKYKSKRSTVGSSVRQQGSSSRTHMQGLHTSPTDCIALHPLESNLPLFVCALPFLAPMYASFTLRPVFLARLDPACTLLHTIEPGVHLRAAQSQQPVAYHPALHAHAQARHGACVLADM
jgi:hypothetical protein